MRNAKVLALVVAALFGLTSMAAAVNNVRQMPDGTYQNVVNGQACDANGNALTLEASKDRDTQYLWTNAIVDTANVGAICDSTSWLATKGCRTLALHLRVSWPAVAAGGTASPWTARLAVQVRGGWAASNADSVNWGPWQMSSGLRTAVVSGDTSTVVGGYQIPNAAITEPTEFVVPVTYIPQPIAVGTFKGNSYSTSSAWIVLKDNAGRNFWAPYTQVRVRVLTASPAAPQINLDVIGSPL